MVGAASLYSNARDLIEYARAHFSPTHHAALDKAFADVSVDYYPREKEAANIAWVTDTLGGQRITYQVGYIGGYSSYIGFDKANQNAVVVLQNSLTGVTTSGRRFCKIRSQNRPIRQAMSA